MLMNNKEIKQALVAANLAMQFCVDAFCPIECLFGQVYGLF